MNLVIRKGVGGGVRRNTLPRMMHPPLSPKVQLVMTILVTKIGVGRAARRMPREKIGKKRA